MEIPKINCDCTKKEEEWFYDKKLGCWYAIRECTPCYYYWEGPDYSRTNPYEIPSTGKLKVWEEEEEDEPTESFTSRDGNYHIYCYAQDGRYGVPVKFDDPTDIFHFCELNKFSHKEIRVVEPKDDAISVHIIDGKYLYPETWLRFNLE